MGLVLTAETSTEPREGCSRGGLRVNLAMFWAQLYIKEA